MNVTLASPDKFQIALNAEELRILCDCLNDISGLGDDLVPRVGATPAEIEEMWRALSEGYDGVIRDGRSGRA